MLLLMKIGIDLDGTITDIPWFYSVLTKALISSGHTVHIITYRNLNYEGCEEGTIQQLKEMDIQYTELRLCPCLDISAPDWKLEVVEEIGIDILIEDALDNLVVMPPQVKRVWVGSALQNLRF
jgi:uncharacterized HAD superfamily protein